MTASAQERVVRLSTMSISTAVGLEGKGLCLLGSMQSLVARQPSLEAATSMYQEESEGAGPRKQGEAIFFSDSVEPREGKKPAALPTHPDQEVVCKMH